MENAEKKPVTLDELKAAEDRLANLKATVVEDLMSEARSLEGRITEIYAKIREYGGSVPKGTKVSTGRSRAPNFTKEQQAQLLTHVRDFYESVSGDAFTSPGKIPGGFPKSRVSEAVKALVAAGTLEHNGLERINSAYRFKRTAKPVTKADVAPTKRPARK